MYGLEETIDDTERVKELNPQVVDMITHWGSESIERRKERVRNLLERLKLRGVLTLLRVRKTKGSADLLPPGCGQLLSSFHAQHSYRDGVTLTVGGRAFSKHALRARDGWWGDPKVSLL